MTELVWTVANDFLGNLILVAGVASVIACAWPVHTTTAAAVIRHCRICTHEKTDHRASVGACDRCRCRNYSPPLDEYDDWLREVRAGSEA